MRTYQIDYKNGTRSLYEINGSWLIEDGFAKFIDKDTGLVKLCLSVDIIDCIELVEQEKE